MEIGTFFLGAIFGMVIILFIDWLDNRKSNEIIIKWEQI